MENLILTSISLEDIASRIAEKVIDLQQASIIQKEITNENEFLDISQAAELLHFAKTSMYGLTFRRKIPFIKRGKRLIFKRTDLIEWLNAGRKSTKEEIENEAKNYLRNSRMSKRF